MWARRLQSQPPHTAEQSGQAMAEYAVVLALLVAVTMVAYTTIGNTAAGAITTIAGRL